MPKVGSELEDSRGRRAGAWAIVGAVVLGACMDDTIRPADAGPEEPPDAGASAAVDPEEPLDVSDLPYRCEAGVVDAVTGLAYATLEPGGDIPIGGTGQAGLTARLALQLQAEPDEELPEVLVTLLLTNVLDGTDGDSKLADTPQRLACQDGTCELAPVLVEISHLAKLPELEDLVVRVDATVRDAGDADRVLCRARNHGVLVRQ